MLEGCNGAWIGRVGRVTPALSACMCCLRSFIYLSWILLSFLFCDVDARDKIHTKEFCETETFNATCDVDEIILVEHARYGRMRVGRCVKLDYGHVGCAADVLDIADAACSGRRQCIMPIPDTQLAATKPCPDDLKPYFEITYRCVKVPVPSPGNCLYDRYMTLRQLPGYLSNTRSVTPECGNIPDSPWKVEVAEGQTINLTLFEFTPSAQQEDNKCKTYAIVRERSLGRTRNVTLCTIDRERIVYSSVTNSIEIGLASNLQQSFIIKYQAVGCPELTLPQHARATQKGDIMTIVCNNTRETWQLKCVDNQWLGQMANCSAVVAVRPPTESPIHEKKALPYGSSVLIIVAVALTIGLFVLLLGLCCFTRHRQKLCYLEENSHNEEKEEEAERIYTATQWAARPERCFDPNGPGAIFLTDAGDTETDFCTAAASGARVGDIHSHTPLLTHNNSIYTSAMHPKCTCPHRRSAALSGGVNYAVRDPSPAQGGAEPSNVSDNLVPSSQDSNKGHAGAEGIHNPLHAPKIHHHHHHVHFDPDVISDQNRTPAVPQALYTSFKKPMDPPQVGKTGDRNELYPLCVISPQQQQIPS